jgi:hypothetical protein
MTYVPVKLWVPDTAEGGAVTESVNLKACDTCKAAIPQEFMDEHVGQAHPDLTPTPH